MSIMSLMSIEKVRKEGFVLVREVKCFVRSSPHITGFRFDRWKDLMEYMVRVIGNFSEQTFIKRSKY